MKTEPATSKPVALLDLDGTLADYDKAMTTALAALRGPNEPDPADKHEDDPAWLQNRRSLIKALPGFWRNLAPIERGFQVVTALRELKFDLMVLTKGPSKAPNAWTEKVLWCQEHIPDAKVTITEDKSLTFGRVLVDDWPPYFTGWLECHPHGLVVMVDHPHNRTFEHPSVFRYRTAEQDSMELVLRLHAARQRL